MTRWSSWLFHTAIVSTRKEESLLGTQNSINCYCTLISRLNIYITDSKQCVFLTKQDWSYAYIAHLMFQVIQPVMWRGSVLAERANLVLHTRQCTSDQVSETLPLWAQPYLCFLFVSSFCLVIKNRNTGQLFFMTSVGTLLIKKRVSLKETVLVCACACVCADGRVHSENIFGLKYPACHRGSWERERETHTHTHTHAGLHLGGNQDTPALLLSIFSHWSQNIKGQFYIVSVFCSKTLETQLKKCI